MKRFLLFAALLAAVACSDSGSDNKIVVLDFEGAEWDARSASSLNQSYSSNIAAGGYQWQDDETTLGCDALMSDGYILSGTILSSFNSADISTYGDYTKDLYVYNAVSDSTTKGGGRNGSNNFLIAVGNYVDGTPRDERVELRFMDGGERVVRGCFVNSTTYFLNIVKNGNAFSPALGDGDLIILTATGYDAAGNEVGTVEMPFATKGAYIEQWRSWDLSALGAVASIRFNLTGGPETEWGMTTPKYFAIDDITIEQD